MILNGPWSKGYEGPHHLNAKIRVATLVDSFLEKVKKPEWTVWTEYEKPYPRLLTSLGDKTYQADVFFDVFYSLEHMIRHHTMSVELDGIFGHGSEWEHMKDRVRDKRLVEQLNCPVIRIDMYQVTGYKRKLHPEIIKLTDEELMYAIKPVENLKLPLSHRLQERILYDVDCSDPSLP